ncbi:hypothetical protein [Streptomyces sp. NRRL B-24572]|uniref:hypothetical protein n=1 Tax=Streptomyces sp. NRRL B-24572 TaxID=1962156 RepID=UPI000A3720CA|nr:hypothetical protein [Streptomyces sp. NRRL B-24572]
MDGELITAIAATGVSLGAAGVAVWQARTAAASAGAAKEQAKAAKEQVALMRRQLDAEDVDRHQAAGPQFVVDRAHTDTNDSTPYGALVLRQESGPALASVLVTVEGDGVEGLKGEYRSDSSSYSRVDETDIGPMAAGNGTQMVHVALDYHHTTTTILLHLECRAHDGRAWQRSISSDVAPTPEQPGRRVSRSPWIQ